MDKKYGFTGEKRRFSGVLLHQIIALKDFGNVKAGEIGGWIESETNLSQLDNCWVDKDSQVFANSRVMGNAVIVDSMVRGESIVQDDAFVKNAILDLCLINSNAYVRSSTISSGVIGEKAYVEHKSDYLTVVGLGTENRTTTAYKTKDGGVRIFCGCFNGNVDEFRTQVKKTRGGKVAEEYLMFADLVEKYFGGEKVKSEPYKNKFKAGDKVRILDGSKIEDYYGSWDYSNGKVNKRDLVGAVVTVRSADKYGPAVYIKEFEDLAFDDRALELAEPKFKPGDLVRILDGSEIYGYSGSFTKEMKECVGQIARISTIIEGYPLLYAYAYGLWGRGCDWDERGLEKVDEDEIEPLNDVYFKVKTDFHRKEFHNEKIYWICGGKIVNTDDKCPLPMNGRFYTKEDVLEYFKGNDDSELKDVEYSHYSCGGLKIEFVEPEPLNCEIKITNSESNPFKKGEIYKIVNGFVDGIRTRQKLCLPEQLEEYFKVVSERRLVEGNKYFTHWSSGDKVEFEIVEKKLLSTKFVVLETDTAALTKGKIYEVVDGRFLDDVHRMEFPLTCLYSFKELEDYLNQNSDRKGKYGGTTKIMEIVE